jgi:hypothetical protein
MTCALIAVSASHALAAATPPKPPPPKVPSVSTGGYSQVSPNSVTLHGNVNPHGLGTVYAFQFGTTTGYGAQTAPVSAGNGTIGISVSQTITGFPPGSTYHYRLIATNAVGTANGHDATFTLKIPLKFRVLASPDPVVFGDQFTVNGALTGTGATGRQIVLQANPFPYLSGFKNIAGPELIGSTGEFSFPSLGVAETTELRVVTVGAPELISPIVVARVAARVSMHLRSTGRHGFVRMYGAVAPDEAGSRVLFQLTRPGLTPLTVGSTIARPAGTGVARFSRVVRIRRRGLYRAVVLVGNGRQVTGHSRPLLIR